jgi:hypothetical protein
MCNGGQPEDRSLLKNRELLIVAPTSVCQVFRNVTRVTRDISEMYLKSSIGKFDNGLR